MIGDVTNDGKSKTELCAFIQAVCGDAGAGGKVQRDGSGAEDRH